jgi:hypothetical protein
MANLLALAALAFVFLCLDPAVPYMLAACLSMVAGFVRSR